MTISTAAAIATIPSALTCSSPKNRPEADCARQSSPLKKTENLAGTMNLRARLPARQQVYFAKVRCLGSTNAAITTTCGDRCVSGVLAEVVEKARALRVANVLPPASRRCEALADESCFAQANRMNRPPQRVNPLGPVLLALVAAAALGAIYCIFGIGERAFGLAIAALCLYALPVVLIFGITGIVIGVRRLFRMPKSKTRKRRPQGPVTDSAASGRAQVKSHNNGLGLSRLRH
jgi:hypothetical protein